MNTFEELDLALKSRGWRYDRGQEQFLDGARVLNWDEVLRLLPSLSLDELASYQDDKYDELCRQR